jgi:D-3-phosphoglycerate dehydrogenase
MAGAREQPRAKGAVADHRAGSTDEALQQTAEQCAAQIIEVLQGRKPAHLVNPQVWEARRKPA